MTHSSPLTIHRLIRSAVIAGWAVGLAWAFTLSAPAAHGTSTSTPWQNLTQPQLTAVWWQWVFSVPVSSSPFVDPTGANATANQPYYTGQGTNELFFLAGTFIVNQLENGDVLGEVTRSITVKQGTALFFPLINAEWDNICNRPKLGGNCFSAPKFPAVLGVPALQARAGAQIDPVTGLFATLEAATGTRSTGYQRLQSPPFSYALPASDNLYQSLFGIKVRGTVSPAAADGYWSFIPGTLAPGQYVLHFGGRSPLNAADPSAGSFIERITYHVTVTP